MARKLSPAEEFDKALAADAADYGVALAETERTALGLYFETVMKWNPRLHLVAPCAPAVFATRHILESLLALPFLPLDATVVDIGSGAGLPIIPCLIMRPDLRATLYESSPKKAVFLREALREVGRRDAAAVVVRRFEETEPPAADALTCRAIERFTEILPRMLLWAASVRTLLLFGGEKLRDQLEARQIGFVSVPVPGMGKSFLFVVQREEKGGDEFLAP